MDLDEKMPFLRGEMEELYEMCNKRLYDLLERHPWLWLGDLSDFVKW